MIPPRNTEHHEALQAEEDAMRKKFFAEQTPEVQDNLKFIEDFVGEINKRNLPFIIFINPFGYEFDSIVSKKGFWQYNKLGSNYYPYSKEGYPILCDTLGRLASSMLKTLSYTQPDYIFTVDMPENSARFIKGQLYWKNKE